MLGFCCLMYIYNNMRPIKLKDLINESYINSSPFSKNLNEDLKYLEQKLIEEGLWDIIKQKVGDATNKTKEILLKPLIKLVVDKIAKDDPQGFSKLQQYADASKLKDLLNHPDIKKKESEIGKEVASVKESLSEAEHDDFIQEYIDAVLDEARVLRDDPRNVKRRERYQQRRAARVGQNPAPVAKKTNPSKVDKSEPSQPKNNEPTAGQNIKKGAEQLGKGIAQGADKLGIAAIEKGGDIMAKAMGGAGKGVQALAQTDAGKAIGGLIGKIYQWTKAHPKLTASAGIALLGLIGTAAAIGSGGIVPLIVGTLGAAGSGAVKGGVIGGAVGAARDAYSQIKGGTKSFKDMDYKQMGKSALKAGGKGAAIGAAVGAGANVLSKAAAGVADVASGQYGKAMKGLGPDNTLRDLTPGEKRNLGVKDGFMDDKGQYKRHSTGPESIKQNYFKVGGEIVTPGEPLTQNQLNAMKMAIDMGNDGNKLYGSELMKQYDTWNAGAESAQTTGQAAAGETVGGGNAQNPVGNDISKQIQAARTDPEVLNAWKEELNTNPAWKKYVEKWSGQATETQGELNNAINSGSDSRTIAQLKAKLYNIKSTLQDLENTPNRNWIRTHLTGEEDPFVTTTRKIFNKNPDLIPKDLR